MSEHGWPGWVDEPAGHGPQHPDPHDGDQPGDELHTPDWGVEQGWEPAQDIADTDPGATAVPYDTPAGYADASADEPDIDEVPYPQGVDGGPLGPVGADPDAVAGSGADAELPFPPAVDVGELPEPVDGFPWIDTGTLGVVAADTTADAAAGTYPAVDPADLAAYAREDLPPAVDPWAALAASDDPATSALARFWAQEQ